MAGVFCFSNVKKTWRYLQKNGFASAFMAAWERLEESRRLAYSYEPPDKETLLAQRNEATKQEQPVRFSVVTPVYEKTPKAHLLALLDSLLAQSWPFWELVLADASRDDSVKETLTAWAKEKGVPVLGEGQPFTAGSLRYLRLKENLGISENTNAGLGAVQGEYTGLLDHDDLLTPDALYEMARAIKKERDGGREPLAFYSDEDKCDATGHTFYEPHFKTEFDPELILSNNYICHFLVMQTELLGRLRLRRAYEGAQDYDLVLRAVGEGISFVHVPRVLYHWRCHAESTALNPESKQYAYEAGRRAIEDFCRQRGWRARVSPLPHLGFYRVDYKAIWEDRPQLGAVAFPVIRKRRLISGIYEETGAMRYEGLRAGFTGPMHRARLQQQAGAVALDQLRIRPGLEKAYRTALAIEGGSQAQAEAFSRLLAQRGLHILWDPQAKAVVE